MNRSRAGNAAAFLFLAVFGVFIALPMYYSVINAFKPISELFLFPPRFVVYHPTLQNFAEILRVQSQSLIPVERYVFNSVFVTAASTGGYILLASMAGYAMAKLRFPGKTIINRVIVFAILFRPEVTSIPQYIIMAKLQVIDTYWALILPAMGTSFGVFLLMQFMEAIPNEIIESCRIDGAKEVTLFFRLILPMVKPAWLTVVIFTFTSVWNTNGVQFIYSESRKMLPAMLSQLSGAGVARAGVASAVAVLLLIPPVVIFLFSQKSVVETMAHSGLKG